MMRIAAVALALVCCFSTCFAEDVNFSGGLASSPLGIYNAAGEMLFSLGTLRGEAEDVIGSDSVGYRLILDADEIVLPVPVKPEPTGMVAYEDAIEALVAAAPTTVSGVDEILSPFGIDSSYLLELTKFLTKTDIELGIVDAEHWESVGELLALEKETYEIQLQSYEAEMNTPYEQWLEDVRSSLTIERGMLSLMIEQEEGVEDKQCEVFYDKIPEFDELWESIGLPERQSRYTMLDIEVSMTEMLEGRSFESVDERNLCIKQTFDELVSKYREVLNRGTVVSGVLIESFGCFTEKGEYIGMPVDKSKLDELGLARRYYRYYSGDVDKPVELSHAYVSSMDSEQRDSIMPLYCVEIRVSSDGYIDRIYMWTMWE